MTTLSPLAEEHLKAVASFYDNARRPLSWSSRAYRGTLAHYYNLLIPSDASVLEIGSGAGDLLALLNVRSRAGVDLSRKQVEHARERLNDAAFWVQAGEHLNLTEKFDYIIVSDTVNFAADVQAMFERLHSVAHKKTRLILNFHNTLWRPLLRAATWTRFQAQPGNSLAA